MKNLSQFILIFVLIIQFSCSPTNKTEENSLKLWYDKPAQKWEEALPLGNGRLGVMVFGKTATERIQLNDDSMWPAETGWKITDGNKGDLEQVRNFLFEGKITEADQMMVDKFSRKGITRSHQTLGELFIELNHENITEYRRELDLNKAISTVSYKSNGQPVSEKVFVSKPHQAIIIEIKTTEIGRAHV